jgi:hypothetical protein
MTEIGLKIFCDDRKRFDHKRKMFGSDNKGLGEEKICLVRIRVVLVIKKEVR